MILARGSELRNGSHCPEIVADVVGVAVVEPVGIGIVQSATGDAAIRRREICGIVQRSERVFTGLTIARLLIIHGINGRPAGGVAGQACARTATVPIRRSLLVNRPRAKVSTTPELAAH